MYAVPFQWMLHIFIGKTCDDECKKPIRSTFFWKGIFWKSELIMSIKSWGATKKLHKPVILVAETNIENIKDWNVRIQLRLLISGVESSTFQYF